MAMDKSVYEPNFVAYYGIRANFLFASLVWQAQVSGKYDLAKSLALQRVKIIFWRF